MINSVPLPRTELKLNFPPWVDSTILRAIANPNPVPFPTAFVVNKWSNIFELTDSLIPFPLSAMAILTRLFSTEVVIVMQLGLSLISSKLRP